MAAAARPNPADARIPCPMCGGLIHPIAGRCKHCKGDLSALRSARPAAVASLPALHAKGQVAINPYANGTANGHPAHTNGHANGQAAPYAPMAAMSASAPTISQLADHMAPMHMPAVDGSTPILPPRPTGRMYASTMPRSSWWKSWPLIVIVLAVIAIVTAVVLMVWPPGGTSDKGVTRGNSLAPPPAPERMDTNPLVPNQPPARSGDPWSDPNAPKPTKPNIDIPDDPDPDDPSPPTGSFGGFGGVTGAITMSMMRHACDRAEACGKLDSTLKDYCQMAKGLPTSPVPASCLAAKRCFDHIDEMSCTTTPFDDVTALGSVQYKIQDCVEALVCS